MIYQTYSLLVKNVNRFGCYLMSILFHVQQKEGRTFSAEDVNLIYNFLTKETGIMEKDCFIIDPPLLFTILGLPMKSVIKAHALFYTNAGQLEILRFERTYTNGKGKIITYGHFCAGDGNGNVLYDPAGNSNAVKYGRLESKRIFTRS